VWVHLLQFLKTVSEDSPLGKLNCRYGCIFCGCFFFIFIFNDRLLAPVSQNLMDRSSPYTHMECLITWYITLRFLKGRYHGNQFFTQNCRNWWHTFIRCNGIPKQIAISQLRNFKRLNSINFSAYCVEICEIWSCRLTQSLQCLKLLLRYGKKRHIAPNISEYNLYKLCRQAYGWVWLIWNSFCDRLR